MCWVHNICFRSSEELFPPELPPEPESLDKRIFCRLLCFGGGLLCALQPCSRSATYFSSCSRACGSPEGSVTLMSEPLGCVCALGVVSVGAGSFPPLHAARKAHLVSVNVSNAGKYSFHTVCLSFSFTVQKNLLSLFLEQPTLPCIISSLPPPRPQRASFIFLAKLFSFRRFSMLQQTCIPCRRRPKTPRTRRCIFPWLRLPSAAVYPRPRRQ